MLTIQDPPQDDETDDVRASDKRKREQESQSQAQRRIHFSPSLTASEALERQHFSGLLRLPQEDVEGIPRGFYNHGRGLKRRTSGFFGSIGAAVLPWKQWHCDVRPRAQISLMFVGTPTALYTSILFLAVPTGFALNYTGVSPIAVFSINMVAIVPCARALGWAVHDLCIPGRARNRAGMVINNTFSNAVQLISSVILLRARLIDLLRTTLMGSIISNLLLMTGLGFFLGGISRHEQRFNASLAQTIGMLLLLAISSLVIPTASRQLQAITYEQVKFQSRGTAIMTLISYVLWLYFQLGTHAPMFEPVKPTERSPSNETMQGLLNAENVIRKKGLAEWMIPYRKLYWRNQDQTKPSMDVPIAVAIVALSTVLIGFCTEFVTNSIQELLERTGLSQYFVGLIILPLISCDPASIAYARDDRLDVSLSLTLDRCMQTALMVVPLVVLLAWIFGIEGVTLQFDAFTVAAVFVSIILITRVVHEGRSHWLTGILLIGVYAITAVAAFFIPSPTGLTRAD